MGRWFSDRGLPLVEFVSISTLFLMTMLSYLERKIYERRRWIHHLFLGVLILRWLVALAFDPLQTKMFATLMLLSVVVVEIAVGRQRKNRA